MVQAAGPRPRRRDRLNVLLNDAGEEWAEHLPRLLEPQGVRAIRIHDVDQAVRVIERQPVHAVVVEIQLPMESASEPTQRRDATGGLKLLQVLRRVDATPPAVVIRGRRFERGLDDRLLAEALKLQAFSVLDEPVQMEQLLEVLRRLVERHYGGVWPGKAAADADPPPPGSRDSPLGPAGPVGLSS